MSMKLPSRIPRECIWGEGTRLPVVCKRVSEEAESFNRQLHECMAFDYSYFLLGMGRIMTLDGFLQQQKCQQSR